MVVVCKFGASAVVYEQNSEVGGQVPVPERIHVVKKSKVTYHQKVRFVGIGERSANHR